MATQPSKPNPVDVHVGSRIRLRRTLLAMSQETLANALGLTFQQVQKYEHGTNRVSASRLYRLSQVLDVPVSFFFDDLNERGDGTVANAPSYPSSSSGISEADPMSKRETLELLRAYYRISDPNQRKRLFELVKAMASPEEIEAAKKAVENEGNS